MYEDRPEKDTPEYIKASLIEYGGVSPDGQPIWRLVRAENCRIHCFGRRNHIASGRIAAMDECTRPTDIVPDRIEEGDFWFPRYPDVRGWILQRWYPASVWGSREAWDGQKAQDGRTRLLAAYPNRGDYMIMPWGPVNTLAEIGDLTAAIRSYNMQQRANPANWQNRLRAMVAWEAQDRQRVADEFAEELEAQYRESVSWMLRTASGSAQEFRNLVAAQAGGVNLGASERWGN